MAWADALGDPVHLQAGYQVGRRCVHAYYDYFACRELRRQGGLSLAAWLGSWLRSTKSTFEWSDPLPAFVTLGRILGSALKRRFLGTDLGAKP